MAQIEKFGLDSVPARLRTSRWHHYFMMQFAFSFNAGNFLLPSLAVLDGRLSFAWAVAGIVFGSSLAYVFGAVLAFPGVDYGIPGQYAIRSVLGVGGSRFFSSPLRSVASVYWFSVQSLGAAVVIQSALAHFGLLPSVQAIPIAIVLAALMSIAAIVGYGAISALLKYLFPFMIVIMVTMGLIFAAADAPQFQWSYVMSFQGDRPWFGFLLYGSLAFAQFISAINGTSDIGRYAKTRTDAFAGLFAGNLFGLTATSAFAAYTAIAAGEWNPYVAASRLADSWALQLFIVAGVLVSLLAINLSNAYTGGFSLLNTFPRLGRAQATAAIGGCAAALCLFPDIIDDAKLFITMLGSLFVPLGGVVLVDYVWVKRMVMEPLALQHGTGVYRYWRGYNIPAFIAIGVSLIYYYSAPPGWFAGLTACLAAGVVYGGLTACAGRLHSKAAKATKAKAM